MSELNKFTDEQLLMELIKRNGYESAPTKVIRNGNYFETEIDIGEYNGASIVLAEDDYAALKDEML